MSSVPGPGGNRMVPTRTTPASEVTRREAATLARRERASIYALGNLGTNIYLQAFATFALFFYVDHLGASIGLISLFLGLQVIWNALLNPVLGQLSDRTRSPLGRRVPYILALSLPLGAVFWLIWRPLFGHALLPLYFALSVGLFDLLYVAVTLNWTSLFPEMFRTIEARAQAQWWRQGVGVVALMIGVALPPLIYGHFGWSAMGLAFGIVGTVGFLLSTLGAKESSATAAEPSDLRGIGAAIRFTVTNPSFLAFLALNFLIQFTFDVLEAVLPFFAKYVMHVPNRDLTILLGGIFVVALGLVYPWSRVVRRLGSRRAMALSIVLLAAGALPFAWLTGLGWGLAAAVLLGAGLAGFLLLSDVLIAEVVDDDARRAGRRREGSFFGVNGFVVRFGVTLEAGVVYLALHASGYHANAAGHASASVVDAMRLVMVVVPWLALILAYAALRRVRVAESPHAETAPLARSVT